MSHSFNLVDQPFVPCRRSDGTFAELSLLEIFREAHRLEVIADPSPLVTAALHRLLLTVLHRCFGPATPGDWAALWRGRDQGFPMECIRTYLVQWQHRFDLFHETQPFYQTAALRGWPQSSPASRLLPELASGNNATLFDHTCDKDAIALTPPVAARAIIAAQSFSAGGLVSFERKVDRSADAAPLASGAMVLVRGESLAATLLLNLHQYDPAEGEPFPVLKEDLPAWERDAETVAEDRVPLGYLDLLTWQSRRIILIPVVGASGSTLVSSVVIMKGNQFPDEWPYRRREPLMAFRPAAKPRSLRDAWLPVSIQPGRAVWRDSSAFLQFQAERDLSTRPRLFQWLNRLIDERILPEDSVFSFDLFGQATDQASVLLWRHERLPLTSAYVTEPVLAARLQEALSIAEEAVHQLWGSAREVLKALGTGKGTPHLTALENQFWSTLELEFLPFFRSLPLDRHVGEDGSVSFGEQKLPEWTATVSRAASRCFEDFSRGLGAITRVTITTAQAENRLRARLPRLAQAETGRVI